jgi:hypothetical protein
VYQSGATATLVDNVFANNADGDVFP